MKRFYSSVLLMLSLNAFASDCTSSIENVANLSAESKAALVAACEASQVKPKESMTILEKFTDANHLTEISHIAKVAGQTVREVAYELNVASNEFIKSPVGMITAGLAIWYVTGDSVLSIIGSLWRIPIGFLLIYLSYFLTRKIFSHILAKEYEDIEQTGWFGKKYTVRRIKEYYSISDKHIGEGPCFALFVTGIAAIIMFTVGFLFVAF